MLKYRDPAAVPRAFITAALLVSLWPMQRVSELDLGVLADRDNVAVVSRFLAAFWPLAHSSEFLAMLWHATLQTIAMATAGIALALLVAVPASLAVSRILSVSALVDGVPARWSALLRMPLRWLLVALRSVPEVVWALLLVRAVGLGPTAGVIAIAITYAGMLGKVFAEIFESSDPRPVRALLLGGSSRLAAFCYGVLPSASAEVISYTVYRWECAIRASIVMGFVGAGGLGQQLDLSLRMFEGAEVASMLLTFLVLVLLADQLSRLLRWRLAPVVAHNHGRAFNALLIVALAAAVLASFASLSLDWAALFSREGSMQISQYVRDFFPADTSVAHGLAIARGAVETLAISAAGTVLAALVGALLALPAAGRFGAIAKSASRLVLNALRAVPELVWASLMVLAAGLGPNAGTLALALHTGGVLGRLFAEALENVPASPADALRLAGAGRINAFCYGALPWLWPQLLAYTLYRWENNIRMASVLGVVGAGGLGQMLYTELALFQQRQAIGVIAAMLVLVAAVDALSGWLRQRWVVA